MFVVLMRFKKRKERKASISDNVEYNWMFSDFKIVPVSCKIERKHIGMMMMMMMKY